MLYERIGSDTEIEKAEYSEKLIQERSLKVPDEELYRQKTPEEDTTPAFWTGEYPVDPSAFTIDCGGKVPPVEEMAPKMEEIYAREGAIHLTNTGLTDMQEMRKYVEVIMKNTMKYEGGANSRQQLEPFFYEVGAPLIANLHYHHEMTYVSKSTKNLGFSVKSLPKKGGPTYISESLLLTEELLKTELGQKLKDKGVCYHRNLTSQKEWEGHDQDQFVYNHWQISFGTDDINEAVRKAEERGLVCEIGTDPWGRKDYLKTKYFADAFEYFPKTDKNVLYSSIADNHDWFDTWPGLCDVAPEHRPLKMTFGDLSEFTQAEWKQWVALYDKYGMPLNWQVGDVAVICNYRWAHARPSIKLEEGEKRQLGVVLGETFDRVGEYPDKW
jgi:hypothetical protein